MRLAIPYWRNRVSPVLDVAEKALVVDIRNEREIQRIKQILKHDKPFKRATYISKMGVKLIICCAISEQFETILQSVGIKVHSNIYGPVEEVLKAFLDGTLKRSNYSISGCYKLPGNDRKRGNRLKFKKRRR